MKTRDKSSIERLQMEGERMSRKNKYVPSGIWLATLAALCWITSSSNAGVQGEYFVDIYGGHAVTGGDTIKGEYQYVSIFGSTSRERFSSRYDGDDSFIYGARFGLWPDSSAWFGFALDGSYFSVEPSDDDLDLNVFVLSPLLMARYPLVVSDDFPHGRWQPYLAVGPALALVDTSFTFDDGTEKADFSDIAGGIGPDFRMGSTAMVSRKLGVFIEYRYTYIRVDSDINDDQAFLGGQITGMKTTLSTHYMVGGISIRF